MSNVAGRYERLSGEPETPHRCRPPGWWRRWRDGVKGGAIWQCACGERYEFRPWEPYRKGIGRAGQPHPGQPGFPYWWRLFEMGPSPTVDGRHRQEVAPAGRPPTCRLADAPAGADAVYLRRRSPMPVPDKTFAARLRSSAIHQRRFQPWPESSPLLLTADEADVLADALDALQRLAEADPVEESIRDLVYRCRYCGENGRHEPDCAWRLARAALDRLAGA